jgi:hypothetical protein
MECMSIESIVTFFLSYILCSANMLCSWEERGWGLKGNNVHWVELGEGIVTFFLPLPTLGNKPKQINKQTNQPI